MARQRKGQLLWRSTKGWCARIPITIDGERIRKVVELGTRDKLANGLQHRLPTQLARQFHPERIALRSMPRLAS